MGRTDDLPEDETGDDLAGDDLPEEETGDELPDDEPPDEEPDAEEEDGDFYTRTTVRRGEQSGEIEASLAEWEEGVAADAAANGGLVPPKTTGTSMYPTARLKNVAAAPAPPADTETELNGLIAECRFLLHEVAFNSARLTYDPNDRIRFLTAAENLALTAAKVGDTIGRLRAARQGSPTRIETRRHELVYTHVQTLPPPSPPPRESGKQ